MTAALALGTAALCIGFALGAAENGNIEIAAALAWVAGVAAIVGLAGLYGARR